MGKTHRLDLLNNSISYFREAVSHAQQESPDTSHWKFAIVHVVQAMELAFKEYLRRIHPVFIFESVDRADKTIGLKGALARLRNPSIGNVVMSDTEKTKIERAFDLRYELTHFEFNHEHEHIELKFAEIFGFMIFFYRMHLKLETSQFVDEEQHQKIIQLVKARGELLQRVQAYIAGVDTGDVWMCPSCTEDAFVVADRQCCFCHHKEEVVECESCGAETLSSETVDTRDLMDWDISEGVARLIDDLGLKESACSECISDVRGAAEDRRREQEYEYHMMEAYERSRRAS